MKHEGRAAYPSPPRAGTRAYAPPEGARSDLSHNRVHLWSTHTSLPPHAKRDALMASARHAVSIIPAALAYAAVLHWVYAERAAPVFDYLGYTYRQPQWQYYTFALFVLGAAAVAMPSRVRRPSDFILWLLFILVGAPTIMIPQYSGALTEVEGMVGSLGMGLAFLATTMITRRLDLRVFPQVRASGTSLWLVIAAISAFVYGYLAMTTGLQIRLVGIADVYDLRDEYRGSLATTGGLLGYLVAWQGNVINPLIVVRGIFARRIVPIILGSVGQLILFSATGFKTIMLSVPALIVVAWLFRKSANPRGVALLWAASALSMVCVALDYVTGSVTWTSLFVRRFLLTSGMLTSTYLMFFGHQPKLYLSHSVLAPWIEYPFSLPYTRQVGLAVTGNPATSMNANVFADGFANAGWVGVAIACIAVALILALVDDASRGLPIAVPATMMLLPTIAMSNSALLTALLTHGVALSLVLLTILPKTGWERPPSGATATHPRTRTRTRTR